ncbi:MAG: SemiSWEET family transporter, partial [Candidatus Micrarchaeia archaeon]
IVQSWKTKSTGDISLYRYVVYFIGLLMWVGYGYLVGNGPIMVMNAVGLLLAGSILYLKLKYG